jgi:hypothetical protein
MRHLYKKRRFEILKGDLKLARNRLLLIDLLISIARKTRKNCRKFGMKGLRTFYYKLKVMEKKEKTMAVVFKGMQLSYLNTVEKFLSIQNKKLDLKASEEDELKKIIIEEEEKHLSESKCEEIIESKKNVRNLYSKNWYERMKIEKKEEK